MKFITLVLLALSLSACQTGYKKIGEGGTVMGYDDTLVKPGVYRVTYQERAGSSPLKAYDGFLHRAAELAKQNGSPYFAVTEGTQGVNQQWSMAGMINLPSYTGTVTFMPKADANTFEADQIMTKHAAEDQAKKEKAKVDAENAAKPAVSSNPFAAQKGF